ncbi:hypothetical protein PRUB_a2003 [Pseudoalteromonas rubra]|uniref:Uncharacterized protein n=1 Tax=Pseudoalteromonas rubra TaxID=43658 RepID=A0A8T0CGU3_9GAMM|nr:hypothetical protein [Pseudoalteromonas rubra]KAF7788902.1 hypothetical protein PRUB_a2003 [Pseudoalteromonas rubra]
MQKKLLALGCGIPMLYASAALASDSEVPHYFNKADFVPLTPTQLASNEFLTADAVPQSVSSTNLSRASSSNDGSSARKRALIYLNGMFTDEEALGKNKPAVRSAFSRHVHAIDHVYNMNEDKLEQFMEVLAQKERDENRNSSADYWREAAYLSLGGSNVENIQLLASIIDFHNQPTDKDLEAMISKSLSYINANYNVVLLAHSQGNFYANEVYDAIAARYGDTFLNHLEIVSVATPAVTTKGGGPHTTNTRDLVMNAIRAIKPAHKEPRAANVSIPVYQDVTGHGLAETYIRRDAFTRGHYTSKQKIINDVVKAFEEMEKRPDNEDDGGSEPALTCLHNGKNYTVTFQSVEEHIPSHSENSHFSGFERTFWPPVGTKFNLSFAVWGANPSSLGNNVEFNWKFGKDSRVRTKTLLNNMTSSSNPIYYNRNNNGSFTFGIRHTATHQAAYSVNWSATLKCLY